MFDKNHGPGQTSRGTLPESTRYLLNVARVMTRRSLVSGPLSPEYSVRLGAKREIMGTSAARVFLFLHVAIHNEVGKVSLKFKEKSGQRDRGTVPRKLLQMSYHATFDFIFATMNVMRSMPNEKYQGIRLNSLQQKITSLLHLILLQLYQPSGSEIRRRFDAHLRYNKQAFLTADSKRRTYYKKG